MKIITTAIVSNSEMMKNYKTCRDKVEEFGKVFVMKNNQPDAVLFSILNYEKISVFIEHLDSLEGEAITKFIDSLPKDKSLSIDHVSIEINKNISVNSTDYNAESVRTFSDERLSS